MSTELKERLVELLAENARIKKTSKQRFDQNKELKLKAKHLEILTSRFEVIRSFLLENNLPILGYEGSERCDFSAMNAIRGLLKKGEHSDKVSVEGLYVVKVDDEYKLARIKHYISWQIMFIDDGESEWNGLHKENVSEFLLIEMED